MYECSTKSRRKTLPRGICSSNDHLQVWEQVIQSQKSLVFSSIKWGFRYLLYRAVAKVKSDKLYKVHTVAFNQQGSIHTPINMFIVTMFFNALECTDLVHTCDFT